MLHRRRSIALTFAAFDDGVPLWVAVWTHELEGVVAKRLHESHVLSGRTWLEIKNKSY